MPPTIGKRAKERFQVLNCNVRVELKGFLGRFRNQMHCAGLVNLSTSGLQVVSYEKLKTNRQYDITIYTPAFSQAISAKGNVIWQKPYDGKDLMRYYRIGFKFTDFSGYARDQIKKLENNPELRQMKRY